MTTGMERTSLQSAYGLGGKIALVTGGGTGIGLAIAKCLHISGARVVIAGRRMDVLQQSCTEIGDGAEAVALDVTKTEGLAQFEQAFFDRYGSIDILVNNAGNTLKKPFEETTIEEFDSVFEVHVRGALELSRRVIKRQLEHGGGNIIFLSSMTAFIGMPMVMSYSVAKSAITGVVHGLAAEYSNRGIRINAVAPGWIDTDIFRKATAGDPERRQKILSRIPMDKIGKPEDVGWACAYLASPAASYVTGQILLVDGGGEAGF